MKNRLPVVSLLMAILFQSNAFGQNEFKFGKVSEEELKMTQYAADTSATAVYLYKEGQTYFTYNSTVGDFGTESDYFYRIKILKPEGKEHADISIPFYVSNGSTGIKEKISDIKAVAYTLDNNGKVQKSELPKKYIFEEKSSGNWRVMKFSIPNVEAGTVIEYKYTRNSNNPYQLDPWMIQGSLPVQYAHYEIQIPEYFIYKADTRGYENIKVKDGKSSRSFDVGLHSSPANVNCKDWTFTAENIPAVKDEPFLWCINDYLTCVEFELDAIQSGNGSYKSYASNWEKVKETLRNYEDFGEMLNLENPYQEDMRAMELSTLPFKEKLQSVFSLLKKKLEWNGKYTLYAKDIKETIKQGSGSNANLNFILMSMLRDAGIKSTPILLRTRPEGRLPLRATIDKLNTFVVAAYDSEGTAYYLDSSIEYGDLNILPSSLMVSQAIVFNDVTPTQFVDLSNIGKNNVNQSINVTIHPDGTFEGVRQTMHTGQSAVNFKRLMANEKDSISTMQKTEEEYNISIKECNTQHTKGMSERCNEQITFSGELLTSDDHIYLNPMIFPDETDNPFTNASRKFPVEFPYAQSVVINTTLKLPEGYQVEELPQNTRATMNQNELDFSYIIRQVGNIVSLRYKATINAPFIGSEQYEELRNFWEEMVNRNNQQIVLKKVSTQP